jgi:hypothetical protein
VIVVIAHAFGYRSAGETVAHPSDMTELARSVLGRGDGKCQFLADTILARIREENTDRKKMLVQITCQAGVVKFFMHAQGLDWSAPAIQDILRNWHDDESAVFVSKSVVPNAWSCSMPTRGCRFIRSYSSRISRLGRFKEPPSVRRPMGRRGEWI